jgi:adenine-specific DNA-methyltransferase
MAEQDFIKAGFTVVGSENNENKLLSFLKENYPNVIRDTEINFEELKTVLGLPIDEKVNGYGLNFVGRNFARAKYAKKTEKELRLNTTLSKNIETTENLVLKGDNLESLKILKNHYSGKIKCIYIDPPYNTNSDEFVYPDKFDKEEAEVLGLANLGESDFARMDFSFKTKKSHNGWLAFMYPRLLLARDLLSKDGVIFISIDDNEQANLKLLCDNDIFGEENFIASFIWEKRTNRENRKVVSIRHDYILCYSKNQSEGVRSINQTPMSEKALSNYKNPDNDSRGLWKSDPATAQAGHGTKSQFYDLKAPNGKIHKLESGRCWLYTEEVIDKEIKDNRIWFGKDGNGVPRVKTYLEAKERGLTPESILFAEEVGTTETAKNKMKELFDGIAVFETPKSVELIEQIIQMSGKDGIILDFFAGSGSTGEAVMQLNAEDGGSRKFILCQIDEPIKKDKPAYQFCIDNNLPPVISSITIERLKRAGEEINKDIEAKNSKSGMFEEHKKQVPDIGFKVFSSIDAPKLKVDEKGQISITENETDALSRIYNMIFTVGLDEPTQVPEEVVKDSIYKIDNHCYITNSQKITSDDYSNAIKNGKVFIDGWTASLNGTLQNYKEDVKIVF